MHETDIEAIDPDSVADIAKSAAVEAGNKALRYYRSLSKVDTKDGKTDYVTVADLKAQQKAVDVISEHRPDDEVVGEEGDGKKEIPEEGACWIIDPIDGTSNFVRGANIWTTSVAFVVDGEPVAAANYIPTGDDLYVADTEMVRNGNSVEVSEKTDKEVFKVVPTVWWGYHRRDEFSEITKRILTNFGDMHRLGSVQAVLSMVASGAFEAAVTNVEVNPWDSVAGVHMVRCAGGKVTDADGDRWTPGSVGLVASNGHEHEAVRKTVDSL
jgi:myo-inositol-1(or 4)-monophosphatase